MKTRGRLVSVVLLAAAAVLSMALQQQAVAQTFPSKTVRIVVPSSAGGISDGLARALAQRLQERWGQTVLVENRAGANGVIGTDSVAKAEPDGHTLLLTPDSNLVMNPSLYPKLPYDPVRDFAPVSVLCSAVQVMVVHPSVPVKSVGELIALAKAKPGTLTYASTGSGSTTHLNTELIKGLAGIDLVHVPYKGGAPALRDVVGGQVSMMIIAASLAEPFVTAGKLRALAITQSRGSSLIPGVPTFAQAGLAGYSAPPWFGIVVPAGTPKAVIGKIHAELVAALGDAAFRQSALDKNGLDAIGSSPAEFAAFIETELPKWAKIVQQSGARIE